MRNNKGQVILSHSTLFIIVIQGYYSTQGVHEVHRGHLKLPLVVLIQPLVVPIQPLIVLIQPFMVLKTVPGKMFSVTRI